MKRKRREGKKVISEREEEKERDRKRKVKDGKRLENSNDVKREKE